VLCLQYEPNSPIRAEATQGAVWTLGKAFCRVSAAVHKHVACDMRAVDNARQVQFWIQAMRFFLYTAISGMVLDFPPT